MYWEPLSSFAFKFKYIGRGEMETKFVKYSNTLKDKLDKFCNNMVRQYLVKPWAFNMGCQLRTVDLTDRCVILHVLLVLQPPYAIGNATTLCYWECPKLKPSVGSLNHTLEVCPVNFFAVAVYSVHPKFLAVWLVP